MDSLTRQFLLNTAGFENSEEKLKFSKILNNIESCEKKHMTTFSEFLDPVRVSRYISAIKSCRNLDFNVSSFGGYVGAERAIISFYQSYETIENSDFLIDAINIKFDTRFSKPPTHRDFLGSIIGLGLERSKIGDIVVNETDATVFVSRDISGYIISNLEKIGHSKVKTSLITYEQSEINKTGTESTITVVSLRIDSVLAHIFNISRTNASEFLNCEKVFINWKLVTSASKNVSDGDVITLRGKGRATVVEVVGKSKRDRFILKILK